MNSACFNCGASDHKNYQCPHPKSSGSAEIKRNLRKEFRKQNPGQQEINMKRYLDKQSYLRTVLKEDIPIPFCTINKFVNKMLDKLTAAVDKLHSNMAPISILSIDDRHEKLVALKNHIADLLPEVRELYCYYQQIDIILKADEIQNKHYYYCVPPILEQDILRNRVDQMQQIRTSVWQKINKRLMDVENLQGIVTSILEQISRIDKYVFKCTDPSFVLDPETIIFLMTGVEDIEKKIPYLDGLEFSDSEYIGAEMLRIRKKVNEWRLRDHQRCNNVAASDDLKVQREQCLKELRGEIQQIQSKSKIDPGKLLDFILTRYPPRYSSCKLDCSSSAKLKLCFKKALLCYHPDKQTDHELKWQVLCEEITKAITVVYSKLL